LVALAPAPAAAQGIGALQQGDEPLEINADEGIEWRRDEQLYIARGNARAAQGDLEVFADELVAHYRTAADGSTDVFQIDAVGNVRIVSPNERAYGDIGNYYVDKGLLMLRGKNLKMETVEDVITARDSLEYWEEQKIAVARGNAVATRGEKKVRAQTITAYFAEDAAGDLAVQRVDGLGDVEISSPTEFARADKGVYYVDREIATLSGRVKVTRGDSQLNGEFAEVNLKTGVSRLTGSPTGGGEAGRVRGLLIPQRKPDLKPGS